MKAIVVTGGAGFIGSHTSLSLLEKGYNVFIIDSFVNSSKEIIDKIKEFRKESLNLRFQKASGQLENTVRISVVRKEIARLKTIYNENFRK